MLWFSIIFCCIWLTCHLPSLLIFTINHQKKVEQNQPPTGLQFHGGSLELEEMNESRSNEGDVYIIPQQRKNIFENSLDEVHPHQTF